MGIFRFLFSLLKIISKSSSVEHISNDFIVDSNYTKSIISDFFIESDLHPCLLNILIFQ